MAARIVRSVAPRWPQLAVAALFVATTFAFMPQALAGQRTYVAVDMLETTAPYRNAIHREPHVVSGVQLDQVEFMPLPVAFWDSLRRGEWQLWDRYSGAGQPLGTLPLMGLLSPTSISFLLFPDWFAVSARIAMLLLACQAFTYLLARRLGTSVLAAGIAAVAFTYSGANLVHIHRMNAVFLLPAMFWAAHRLAGRVDGPRIAVVALTVAWAWLEGFPSGFVFCVYLTGAWFCWLVWCALRPTVREHGWREVARPAVRLVGGGLGALALGAALAAVNLVPFVAEVSGRGVLETREYGSDAHLAPAFMFGLFDLSTNGDPLDAATWFLGANPVEAVSLVGSVAVTAFAAALVLAAIGRLRLAPAARDAFGFLTVGTTVLVVLDFVGTPLLEVAYRLPGLSTNPIWRSRFAIGLFAALVLAMVIDHWWSQRDAATSWPVGGRALALVLLTVVSTLALANVDTLVDAARGAGRFGIVMRSWAVAGGLALLATAAVLAGIRARRARPLLALGVAVIVFGQLAVPLRDFTPESPVSDFYTRELGHDALIDLAGDHARFSGSDRSFQPRSAMLFGVPDLRGANLWSDQLRALVREANPAAFQRDSFRIVLTRDEWAVGDPVYDHLAVRYFTLGTDEQPYGELIGDERPVERWAPLTVDALSVPDHVRGRVAGVEVPLRAAGAGCAAATVGAALRASDAPLPTARRPASDATGGPLAFALVRGDTAPLELEVTAGGGDCVVEVGLDATGAPAARWIVDDPTQRIRVASTEQAWIYERTGAWPLVSTHSRWRSYPDQGAALDALASGDTPVPVVGDAPEAEPGARPAAVVETVWGDDTLDVRTRGDDRSLVVVSQDLADGWDVTVDGETVEPVKVDGALVGVVVEAGEHHVRLRYRPASFLAGVAVSVVAALVVVGLLVAPGLRRRFRGRGEAAR